MDERVPLRRACRRRPASASARRSTGSLRRAGGVRRGWPSTSRTCSATRARPGPPTSCTSSGCRCRPLDGFLLPRRHPRVLTAHDVLPREPRPGQRAGQRALYERMDAIVVHSEHGAARLRGELGLDPARVHVIPHGALHDLTAQPAGAQPPPELRPPGRRRPPARSSCSSACCAPTRASTCCSTPGGARTGRPAPSSGSPACRGWTCPRCRGPGVRTALRFVSGAELRGGVPRAPTSSCCRTARSTSPACCSPRSRSASRCC